MPVTNGAAPAGILIVWTDVPREIEADFNHWYNHEHLPDRILHMAGFLRGRRYEAIQGQPKFLTVYDLQTTAVMQSDAHTQLRQRRTERDRFFVPQFRNTIKGICDVVGRAGHDHGEGEYLVLLPVQADAGGSAAFGESLRLELLPRLTATAGIAGATVALRNAAITQASSAKDDRKGDRYVDGLIAVEATNDAGIAAAVAALSTAHLAALGGAPQWGMPPAVLRLTFALRQPAAVG